MSSDRSERQQRAVQALCELGYREYVAKSFVALSRFPSATAKDISEVTDVPRTRVYDAVEELADNGLVQVYYSTPKRYRAVAIEEAVEWVREQRESWLAQFEDNAAALSPLDPDDVETTPEVWSVSGVDAILVRANNLVRDADREVVAYVGDDGSFNERVLAMLDATAGPSVYVLAPSSEVAEFAAAYLDSETATVVEVDLPTPGVGTGRPAVSMTALLADRTTALVRTGRPPDTTGCAPANTAVVSEGADSTTVLLLRTVFGVEGP